LATSPSEAHFVPAEGVLLLGADEAEPGVVLVSYYAMPIFE